MTYAVARQLYTYIRKVFVILKENDKIINYLLNTKDPYILRIDNIRVEMEYCEIDKTFKDCMINILKQRIGK